MRGKPKLIFFTSLYGRIGYLLITLMCVVLGALLLFPLLTGGFNVLASSFSPRPLYAIAAWAILLILAVWMFAYSFVFFIRPGWRVICDQEGIKYRGPFRVLQFNWPEIESFRLSYGGKSPFVFLRLNVAMQNRKPKRYGLDVSGMSPNYERFYSVVFQMAQKAKAKGPSDFTGIEDLDLDL